MGKTPAPRQFPPPDSPASSAMGANVLTQATAPQPAPVPKVPTLAELLGNGNQGTPPNPPNQQVTQGFAGGNPGGGDFFDRRQNYDPESFYSF